MTGFFLQHKKMNLSIPDILTRQISLVKVMARSLAGDSFPVTIGIK